MKCKSLPLALILSALTIAGPLAADHELERFQQQALQLNTFCEGHPRILEHLSKLIKVDPVVTQKTFQVEKCKASAFVAAQLIADKTRKNRDALLVGKDPMDWPAEFQRNGIALSEAADYFENLNVELAFTALDGASKKIRK